jgi:prepilin-type N-terminal cleavage/methylation domain-containing protein/prepilin-type processing-associated H-X9-DG protein
MAHHDDSRVMPMNLRSCQSAERGRNLNHWARGFTLIELLVVVAILAVLASLLIPAVRQCLATAKSANSASNQHQIGVAMRGFVGDHGGRYPLGWVLLSSSHFWVHSIAPYLHDDAIGKPPKGLGQGGVVKALWPLFWSPTTISPRRYDPNVSPWLDSTYSFNGNLNDSNALGLGVFEDHISYPKALVTVLDGGQWAPQSQADANCVNVWEETRWSTTPDEPIKLPDVDLHGLHGWGNISYRDRGAASTLFADGHVERMARGDFRHRNFNHKL